MSTDLDRMLLSEGYTTTKSLIATAEKDTDQVSMFCAGSTWADTTHAIIIVKGSAASSAVHDLLLEHGYITPGKPVVGDATDR